MIDFKIKFKSSAIFSDAKIIYDGDERSGYLLTKPEPIDIPEPKIVLMVSDYVQLFVGRDTGRIYDLSGLAPKEGWEKARLSLGNFERSTVNIEFLEDSLEPNIGYSTALSGLAIEYDKTKKIARIGKGKDYKLFGIFNNLFIGIDRNRSLNSIWISDLA